MEAQWIADRAALRCLARQHPDWTQQELAGCLGRSRRFVKKWLKRFRQAPADDQAVLHSRSCARKTRPPTVHPRIIERIVEMRESPPENLQRVPGPKALLYYLPRDRELQALGAPLPRSTRTSLQDPAATGLHSRQADSSSQGGESEREQQHATKASTRPKRCSLRNSRKGSG